MMDRQEIEKFLKEAPVGRLGTVHNHQPYVVPLNFVYEGNQIFFHSKRKGMKITNIRENEKVCFEIDEFKGIIAADKACEFTVRARSVIALGTAKLIEDIQEKMKILEKIVEKYSPGTPKPFEESEIKSIIIGEIKIETMEGKNKNMD
jgi:nitroimidazol reductase NimA-like FMN-containing flavoprotein (pyridoxamine 5'-phosphate oxidase superfamily)